MKPIVFIISLFFGCALLAQTIDPLSVSYTHADSIALSVPKNKKIQLDELTRLLVKDLNTDYERYRAIFRWIAENIAYSFANKTRDPQKVLQKRAGVCMGYSALFQIMCQKAGLACETVAGYAKTDVSDIGVKQSKTNHEWNVISLYGKRYLIDATWAAGNYTGKFVKDFDESYFLSDPKFLVLSHYPQDTSYLFLKEKITYDDFIKFPIVYSGFVKNKLNFPSIPDGRLKKDFKMVFYSDVPVESCYGGFYGEKGTISIDISRNDSQYIIQHKFPLMSKGEFTLYVNGKAVFGFKK